MEDQMVILADKSFQSAGGAVVWRADAVKAPYVHPLN